VNKVDLENIGLPITATGDDVGDKDAVNDHDKTMMLSMERMMMMMLSMVTTMPMLQSLIVKTTMMLSMKLRNCFM
jgi:hypothetical protein